MSIFLCPLSLPCVECIYKQASSLYIYIHHRALKGDTRRNPNDTARHRIHGAASQPERARLYPRDFQGYNFSIVLLFLDLPCKMTIDTTLGEILDTSSRFSTVQFLKSHLAIIFTYKMTVELTYWGILLGHFALPELGPLGANGLANARDFMYPVAQFDRGCSDVQGAVMCNRFCVCLADFCCCKLKSMHIRLFVEKISCAAAWYW